MAYRQHIKMMRDDSPDGNPDPDYVTYMAGIPADVVPVGGGERYRGRQIEANTRFIIECRFYEGFDTQMIAENEHTGARYLINRILEHQGRQRTLIMECNEVS